MKKTVLLLSLLAPAVLSCKKDDSAPAPETTVPEAVCVNSEDIAHLLSSLNIGPEQVREVHDAVRASSDNGYDEEYTMKDLFDTPGAGVGDARLKSTGLYDARTKSAGGYARPLRDLIEEYLCGTKAGNNVLNGMTAEKYISLLSGSDRQIYWPYSETWDGKTMPVITFDPLTGEDVNTGWYMDGDGVLREIEVNEEMASERPVWVVNSNDDAGYETLQMLRKSEEGGDISIKGGSSPAEFAHGIVKAPSSEDFKTLRLKSFTMLRNYDNWFAGASEFFLKIGSVKYFRTITDSNMYDYTPYITDFMIVVKRKYLGKALDLNTVLVSEWTSDIESCGFMITEYDGGTQTSWKCNAVVKYNSKSYGVEIDLPLNSRDDIVWRGQLGRRFIEKNADVAGSFGDVRVVMSLTDQ